MNYNSSKQNITDNFIFKASIFLIVLFFLMQKTSAVDLNKDSLLNVINNTKDVKTKIDALNALAYEYRRGDKDSGMMFANQSYLLSNKINYHTGKGGYYECMGSFLFYDDVDTGKYFFRLALNEFTLDKNQSKINDAKASLSNIFIASAEYDSALFYAFNVIYGIKRSEQLNSKEKDRKLMWLYQSLGNIYYYKSFYDSSLFYSYQGLRIAESIKDDNAVALFYNQIGNVHLQLNEFEKAINFQTKAATTNLQLENYRGFIIQLSNLADSYMEIKEYQKAALYADSAMMLAHKHEMYRHIPHNYNSLGLIKFKLGNCNEAIKFYELGLEACEKYSNDFIKGNILLDRGNAYTCLQNHKMAILSYKEAIDYMEDDRENLGLCYDGLSKAYAASNDYKNALYFREQSELLNDSVFNERNMQTIQDMKFKYEAEKKEQQIVILQQQNNLKSEVAAKENQKKNFAYTGVAALLFFGGFTYNRYRQRKKLSEQLSVSLSDLKQTQQSLILSEREKEAEQLRVRISRDIHDDMGSNLSRLALQSEMLASGRINNADDVRHSLIEIAEYSRTVVNDLGEIVWSVTPQQDTLQSLIDFMQKHLDKYLKETGIVYHSDFKIDNGALQLRPDIKRNLFLVFKEALNNSVKYAHSKNIIVKIQVLNSVLEMIVADDGKGFNVEEKRNSGNGLGNIYERIKSIGGETKIISSPDNGCEVLVKVTI